MSFSKTVFSLLVSIYTDKTFLEKNLTMYNSKNLKNCIILGIAILLVIHSEEKTTHTNKHVLTRMLLMWLLRL